MTRPARVVSSVLSRYVVREFLAIFGLAMGSFILLYLIVDFFDRLDSYLKYDAPAWAIARYLAFKLPLIVTQMVPPAVTTAMLLSLALIGRRSELVALRAAGVSLYRIARPLLVTAACISVATLAWNEIAVPYGSHESQRINAVEIRRQERRPLLSDREIWYHGSDGFYNIDHVDRDRHTLYGVVIYDISPDFRLQSTTAIREARWLGDAWQIRGATRRRVLPDGDVRIEDVDTAELLSGETMGDFLEVYRKPEELSYGMLRRRIRALERKGIDASTYHVDLHLKLAVPFASLVLAALAIPIAGRARRQTSVAVTVGVGSAVGFAYWVILGLGTSLGHNGALPAVVAAWSANLTCAVFAAWLFLSAE